MKFLTVFTPTYNRAYILYRCYESLKNQSCKDFKWLIIDDGSSDDTKNLVKKWIEENKIEIIYVYQENKGMHGAHNTAYELIDTELNVCIDSDDYMPNNAVEEIKRCWNSITNKERIAGIIGLDAYANGEIVGSKFKKDYLETTLFDFYHKEKGSGDKKLVYRSEISKNYPYPIFKGEKYVGLNYKYYKIDEKYNLVTLNKILCIVEYLEDGSSRNMLRQYRKNPRGFSFYRIENMKNPNSNLKFRLKETIHYVSSSLISKNKNFIKESPCKINTILCIPIGYILYKYIMVNTKEI